MSFREDWAEPLGALALEWTVLCAFTGPVVATGAMVACVAAGGPFGRWLGRKLFGAGGVHG